MSKGERNHIKVRVRSAMAAQAEIEGRFLATGTALTYDPRDRTLRAGGHDALSVAIGKNR